MGGSNRIDDNSNGLEVMRENRMELCDWLVSRSGLERIGQVRWSSEAEGPI